MTLKIKKPKEAETEFHKMKWFRKINCFRNKHGMKRSDSGEEGNGWIHERFERWREAWVGRFDKWVGSLIKLDSMGVERVRSGCNSVVWSVGIQTMEARCRFMWFRG